MRVVVSLDQHHLRTPDGRVWTTSQTPYTFYRRYLAVFDAVLIAGRCQPCAVPPANAMRVDGPGVQVADLPWYHGPRDWVRNLPALHGALARSLRPDDAVILRVPSLMSLTLAGAAYQRRRPIAVEVIQDPWLEFAPGALQDRLRPLWRIAAAATMWLLCRRALAAAYVTTASLQRRYPPSRFAPTTHYTSAELGPEAFVNRPRCWQGAGRRLVHVGMMIQLYKAPDVLLHALAIAVRQGLDAELEMIGDGAYRPALEALTERLGLTGRVRFVGALLGGAAIRERIDAADLMVLPSRAEGLPRAVLEAMARGVPCLGSTIPGFRELLPDDALVPPDDCQALAGRMVQALTSPHWLTSQSAANLIRAREYSSDMVTPRRTAWYRAVSAIAEKHTPCI